MSDAERAEHMTDAWTDRVDMIKTVDVSKFDEELTMRTAYRDVVTNKWFRRLASSDLSLETRLEVIEVVFLKLEESRNK